MQPIYDKSGSAVAWLSAGHVYALDGGHAGFVRAWNVHGNAGEHLGVLRGHGTAERDHGRRAEQADIDAVDTECRLAGSDGEVA